MKGLLLKDWYLLRKVFLLYGLCCLAFQAMPGSGGFLTVLYAAMLPMSAFAYDDRSRWGELAAMLPYSVREIVLSRYVIGWAGILLFNLWGAAGQALFRTMLPDDGGSLFRGASGFLTMLGFSALFLALTFPIHFRFDAEKSRVVRWVMIAVIAGAAGATGGILMAAGIQQTYGGTDAPAVWPAVCGLAVLATAVSVPASMWAYRARRK